MHRNPVIPSTNVSCSIKEIVCFFLLWLPFHCVFFSFFSVIQNLAAQKNYNNLNMTMQEAITSRACCVEGVLKCYPHETLETIIDRIAKAEVTHTHALQSD